VNKAISQELFEMLSKGEITSDDEVEGTFLMGKNIKQYGRRLIQRTEKKTATYTFFNRCKPTKI
jgi:hypothetical protein